MDVSTLEIKLKKLEVSLDALVKSRYTETLLGIIHRPGFTTPQEAQLIHALVDSLHHQFTTLETTHRLLVDAADTIGRD
jgi:hypothetical protein